MNMTKKINWRKHIAEITLLFAAIIMMMVVCFSTKTYATEEFWAVNIGEKTIAIVNSEDDANAVIKGVESYYTKKGAENAEATCEPAMSAEQKFYKTNEAPDTTPVEDAIKYIVTGTKSETKYTVKNGDTVWEIAEDHDLTIKQLQSLNGKENLKIIMPGDKINVTITKPFVKVTTKQTVKVTKNVKFKTVYKKSSALLKNTRKVKQEGRYGKKAVTEKLTTVNGHVVKTVVISSKITKKPRTEVILKGTKKEVAAAVSQQNTATSQNRSSSSSSSSSSNSNGATYSGSGSAVANYALQFVGNPYVYGGSSLTNGTDCSGFVMAVYQHFGISMAHDAGVMRSYGRGVSIGQAQPGDLVCFYGHIGIYVGGGRMVHASNYSTGIIVTSVHYSGTILTVRRIFG